TVGEIKVKEGDKLKVGQVIFTLSNGSGAPAQKKDAVQPAPAAAPKVAAAEPAPAPSAPATAAPTVDAPPRVERRAAPPKPAASEFKLPELGENVHAGDLVRIMISVGARVAEGQPVIELETDKAVVEVPSSVSGVVKEIKVKEGEKVSVGQVVFTLEGGSAVPAEAPRRHTPVEHISDQDTA